MAAKPKIGVRYWSKDNLDTIVTVTDIDADGAVSYRGRCSIGSMPLNRFDLDPVEDAGSELDTLREVNRGLVAALKQAETLAAETCNGQHPDNECWNILLQIRTALAKANATP